MPLGCNRAWQGFHLGCKAPALRGSPSAPPEHPLLATPPSSCCCDRWTASNATCFNWETRRRLTLSQPAGAAAAASSRRRCPCLLITPVHILHPAAQDDFAGAVKEHQPYFAKRVELFNQYKARQAAALEAAKAANVPIRIVLPDGGGATCCCPASRCFPIDGSHLRTAVSHAFASVALLLVVFMQMQLLGCSTRCCSTAQPAAGRLLVAALSLARLPCITYPCLRMRPGSLALPHAAARMLPAERAGVKGVTTPLDIANQISKGLAKKTVVAKVGDGCTGSSRRRSLAWHSCRTAERQAALCLLLLAADAPAPRCFRPCVCSPAAAHPRVVCPAARRWMAPPGT